jgi:hypothetical protein
LPFGHHPFRGKAYLRFATFRGGVKIIQYTGKLVNDKEADRRIDEGADGIFELAPDKKVDGRSNGSLAQFINHMVPVQIREKLTAAVSRQPVSAFG